MERVELPVRLALRVEGDKYNAYLARSDTMEGSVWIGSIAMRFLQNKKRKKVFIDLMKESFQELIEEMFGQKPEMTIRKAPEHEKTKE
jgi:hypothetical protein